MIKTSVILPTYKRPETTKKCLELLTESKYLGERFELEIVMVDSSPDTATWTAVEKLQDVFPINYIHLKKQTLPGEAKNLAVKQAKNELIISLDSDIEVKKDTVWRMIEYLQKNPTIARMTGTSIFSSGSKKGQVDRPTKWDRTYQKNGTTYIEGIYGRYEAFYKTPFLKIGGYDPIFGACGEGTDISVRWWRAGYPLGIDKNIIAYHNSEAPESLRRMIPDRMTAMYRSLFLVAYKYDVEKPEFSPHFIESHEERQAAYGKTIEFHAIVSAAKSIDWFKENYEKIIESKKKVPQEYDFKPFDIFTDKTLLEKCLIDAKKRIESSYRQVFEE